jgi:hypothetical protein
MLQRTMLRGNATTNDAITNTTNDATTNEYYNERRLQQTMLQRGNAVTKECYKEGMLQRTMQ